MQLRSIETTPNPNSMKLNLDQSVGKAQTYSAEDRESCPAIAAKLLDIPGVKSVFLCQDFITLNRDPRADWKVILNTVTHALSGSKDEPAVEEQRQAAEKLGQASVLVQTFRGIPIQVKIVDNHAEKRVALEQRFNEAAQMVQNETGADFLKERYWADWGVRYGELDEIAAEVADEIQGSFGPTELERLVAKALGKQVESVSKPPLEVLRADLSSSDWCQRLRAVQELSTTDDAIPVLVEALNDADARVRRLAAAALGATGSDTAVGPLSTVLLNDPAVGVRRTAGDALSDLANVSAQPAVCQALKDANKLIRWRAARFLADVGTEEALPALLHAKHDSEFEVRLEVEAAIERITSGKAGSMPAWMKIVNNRDSET